MDSDTLIPLVAALGGAIVGGAASVATIWIQQSAQSKREKVKLATDLALETYKMLYENLRERRKSSALLPLAAWQHFHYEILTAQEKNNLTPDDLRRIWKENDQIEEVLKELARDP